MPTAPAAPATALPPIAITGMGIVCAAGNDPRAFAKALAAGTSFLTAHPGHPLPLAQTLAVGRLHAFAERQLLTDLPRTTGMALLAARQALAHAGLGFDQRQHCAVVVGTSTGGMDLCEGVYLDQGPDRSDPRFASQQTHTVAETLARQLRLGGPRSSHSVACVSAACAIAEAATWISAGLVDRALVVGSDALTRITLAGFHSLQVVDPAGCRPLCVDRAGMSLGEGAAALLLERDSTRALGWLRGWGSAADGHHATAPHPQGNGLQRAVSACLGVAGAEPAEVDYINCHGTGTRDNDSAEAAALGAVFGGRMPPVASSKRITGHTLGAAAAIESIACLLALQMQRRWPSAGVDEQPTVEGLNVQRRVENATLRQVLCTNLAFGGMNTALLFGAALGEA